MAGVIKRSSFSRVPIEKTFSLQCRDVLHHRRLAGEPEMILDFSRARRNAFLPLLALNKIKHAPLPVGEHAGTLFKAADQASSNEHSALLLVGRAILSTPRVMRNGAHGVTRPTFDLPRW